MGEAEGCEGWPGEVVEDEEVEFWGKGEEVGGW